MPVDAEGARLSLRLLEMRQKLGIRQDDMAYYFDISRLTYWRWERLGVPQRKYLRQMIKLTLAKLGRKATHRKYHYAKRQPRRRAKAAAKANARLATAAD